MLDTESLLQKQSPISQEFYQLKRAQRTQAFILQSIDVLQGIHSPDVFSHYGMQNQDFPSLVAKAYQIYVLHQIEPEKTKELQ